LEAPLALSKRAALHPIAEWELWIPVNRQNYDCLRRVGAGRADDSCIKKEGASSFPQRVTLGARLYPAAAGFSLLAAVEIGIAGQKNFVRELAPTAPYRVLLAASYNFDLKRTPKREPPPRIDVPVAPKEGRLHGRVVEKGAGIPVSAARVTVPGSALSGPGTELTATSDAQGTFVTGNLPVGNVQLALEAEGYEPASCTGTVPVQGGDADVFCEMVALPRVGTLVGQLVGLDGAPVAGATVQLNGPISRNLITSADGSFRDLDLPPGEYKARVDQEGFLISITSLQIELRKEKTHKIALVPKPKNALVKVEKTRIQLKETVYFSTGTADIEARSLPLLTEVADALLRTPAIQRVEVQGHTDNVGAADFNADLSQRRAESVKNWLAGAGVAPERLEAKGYGLTQPIAPNKGEKGRAKNRRVAFIILERSTPTPQ
jgi:OmpA-OmpF porin, OOP family